jgi:hypothetical protein
MNTHTDAQAVEYPGDYVALKLLDGTMKTHRQQVEEIAKSIGSSLQPDNAGYIHRFEVPSTTNPDKVYLVSQRRSSGQWCCDCPSWKFQTKKGRDCKHVRDILQRLGGYMVALKAMGLDPETQAVAQANTAAAFASSALGMLASACSHRPGGA